MPDHYKRCSQCRVEKPLEEFGSGGRRYYCKPCDRAKSRANSNRRYAIARAELQALRERPCTDCGGRFPHYVMDFDHPDRSVKTGDISQMAASGLSPRVLAEIEKCDLVCANCHRIRTRQQWLRGEWKDGRPRLDSAG
jgi:hypothetical protein